ncbi:MAG: class I SAM-dependent methyltransferase [Candidatus Bathyarchaeia archaeon]
MAEHYFSPAPKSEIRLGLIRCRLRGYLLEFLTSSGVFSFKRIDSGTRLLIESMELPDRGSVLDLGCGYGPVGIVAAKLRPSLEVWMTDVNERAIELAMRNVNRNRVGNVKIFRGFLYEPVVGVSFDTILTNPPISTGLQTLGSIVEGSRRHLKPGGCLQLVVKTNKGGRNLSKIIEQHYGRFEVIGRKGGYRILKADFK